MPFIKQKFHIKYPIKATLFLQQNLHLSQKDAQRIIDKGRIFINDKSFKEKAGILFGDIWINRFRAEDLGIKPIFKTKDFVVFDKPPKLLVHPKGRFYHLSLLDSIKFYFGDNANPINRLDFETSGILLVSLNKQSEIILKKSFEKREVKKIYLALVYGKIGDCVIDLNILEQNKKKDLGIRSIVSPNGKKAITKIEAIKYNQTHNTTLIKAYPITGRTHQIRVHLNHIGHRIVGECLYGVDDTHTRDYLNKTFDEKKRKEIFGADRLMLHSKQIEFIYKNTRFIISSNMDFENGI
ncbi:hypothetical protein CCY99_01505 [Helicobacter sp. 16-1353]|uniref:RluA family pseudouridine synthase n=1 Tax=Helicobacter sp. 16-1353 TaxID=2004996 RepID=UPI000DCAFF6B|nr:RluA family pseudouridine synthase [Helicobacter sp. 16-1353]RAX54856.1 hypothetical protein CCY99_01505 [Helicobacter sp. 16-1353]